MLTLLRVLALAIVTSGPAQANLAFLQASVSPPQATVPDTRASSVFLTFRSDRDLLFSQGQFCSAITTISGVPNCVANTVIQTVTQPLRSGARIQRLTLRIPTQVATRIQDGPVFYVQTLDSNAGITRVSVRLTGGSRASGPARIETGRLTINRAQVFLRDTKQRRVNDRLDVPDIGGGQIFADLRTAGLGRTEGWWVVDAPNGRKRIERFSFTASSSGRVVLAGPDLSEFPQQLAGRHRVTLQFDTGVLIPNDVQTLAYTVLSRAADGRMDVWTKDGRLFWRIESLAKAYAVRIEGATMRWPILSPLSASGRQLPTGATRLRVVDRNGVDLLRPRAIK